MKVTANALPKHMTQFIDPQPTPEVPSSISEPLVVPAPPAHPALIAPLWHTLLISARDLSGNLNQDVTDKLKLPARSATVR